MITIELLSSALAQVGRAPNPEQALAVEAPQDAALFVVAGPGTGKTACLTMRMLKLVFVDRVEPRGILATTFTKKAAAELRSRVLSWGYGVQEWLLDHGGLNRMDRMWVERVDINQIRTGTVDSICEELLRDFRDPGTDPPILADDFVSKTLMLRHGLFGAAGGTRRDTDSDLSRFLAEIDGKIRRSDGEPYGNFYVSDKNEIFGALRDRRIHDEVSWPAFLTAGTSPADAGARALLDAGLTEYQNELDDRMMVDFPQLERTVLDRLQAGQLTEFTDELRVVMVDEYQDTNLLQESLYFALAQRCDGALTVVGDDDQSLYRFRGATVDLFSQFEDRYQTVGGFPHPPIQVFLNANYRSTSIIIGFVNAYAAMDPSYQGVRVAAKPALVNPIATNTDEEFPILGMFRDNIEDLAADLANFVHQVTRGAGFVLPDDRVIQVDSANGGNVGDLALLCSSPKERNFSNDPRLSLHLREELLNQPNPIETFNPRGQDYSEIQIVQLLGGLILCCLDRDGDVEDATSGLSQNVRQTFRAWATMAEDWLSGLPTSAWVGRSSAPELIQFVDHWAERTPRTASMSWPTHIACIELLYDLVHWLPEFHNDPEGQIYLEVFTRQLGAAEQVSGFRAQVVVDPEDPNLERTSIGHLLRYFLAPIAEGTATVDEELMDSFPRDRLNVLSIHQSKGLEFPLVIVDVGADFKASSRFPNGHWKNAFKRFPREGGRPHRLEDLIRPHSPLAHFARSQEDRAFDDLYRQYFVAFSRPEDVLLLVGLNGSHPDRGTIRNVATGWDRNENSTWTGSIPFFDI